MMRFLTKNEPLLLTSAIREPEFLPKVCYAFLPPTPAIAVGKGLLQSVNLKFCEKPYHPELQPAAKQFLMQSPCGYISNI